MNRQEVAVDVAADQAARDDADAKTLAAIKAGNTTMSEIMRSLGHVSKAGDALGSGSIAGRMVDRSLQRLRKAGKIVYSAKTGWAVV